MKEKGNASIEKTKFHLNSHSASMERYSSLDNNSLNGSVQQQCDQKQTGRSVNIPLILKKMNSIEKYVNDFKGSQLQQRKSRTKRKLSPLFDQQPSGHLKSLYSQTPGLDQTQLNQLGNKCYVKYHSISMQHSQGKTQSLEEAQHQYVKLKHNVLPERRRQIISQFNNYGTTKLDGSPLNKYVPEKKKVEKICEKDVQKQLKSSIVNQNGKKYFADLYLMKRERDKVLNSIFQKDQGKSLNNHSGIKDNQSRHTNNKTTHVSRNSYHKLAKHSLRSQHSLLGSQSGKKLPLLKTKLSEIVNINHQEKMKQQEQNFVQQKILKERSSKKSKMLKGRSMNWNVYYQMLALGHNQKKKLKQYCKFSQTYGIQ